MSVDAMLDVVREHGDGPETERLLAALLAEIGRLRVALKETTDLMGVSNDALVARVREQRARATAAEAERDALAARLAAVEGLVALEADTPGSVDGLLSSLRDALVDP